MGFRVLGMASVWVVGPMVLELSVKGFGGAARAWSMLFRVAPEPSYPIQTLQTPSANPINPSSLNNKPYTPLNP